MDTSVSVVVPAYNVEKYVGECLESLLAQSDSNIQIVCVDDGSIDETGNVLRDYSERNENIVVLSQENSGQSVARNNGLKHVSGKYVHFCDSDDLLAAGALDKLVTRAEVTSADIVYFDADSFYENENLSQGFGHYASYYHRTKEYGDTRSGTDMIADMSANGDWRPSVPVQFYRTEFLRENNLAFIPGIIHEDNAFSYCVAVKAKSTSHIKEALYLRRLRDHSTMTTAHSSRNVIGYFRCYLAMLDASAQQAIENSDVLEVPYDTLMLARDIYRNLPTEEREASIDAFDGIERILFWNAVVRDQALLDAAASARAELEAIKNSKRYKLAERVANVKGSLLRRANNGA